MNIEEGKENSYKVSKVVYLENGETNLNKEKTTVIFTLTKEPKKKPKSKEVE